MDKICLYIQFGSIRLIVIVEHSNVSKILLWSGKCLYLTFKNKKISCTLKTFVIDNTALAYAAYSTEIRESDKIA